MKKRTLWTYIIAITIAFVYAMSTHAQRVVLNGTQFESIKDSTVTEIKTQYTYKANNDSIYTVYLSKNRKAFVYRWSSKKLKRYKQYIPAITAILNENTKAE